MVISIIGTGLIGGSMALALKQKGIATKLIGVDKDPVHCAKAIELNLVDEIADLEAAVKQSSLIIIATPVNGVVELLPLVLKGVDKQVVMDVGSTKAVMLEAVCHHPKRSRFVASHPMWGTEYSGPGAAVEGAFVGRAVVVCDKEDSDPDAVEVVERIYTELGMHLVYMTAKEHDMHVAYISHISHIISFALANTVLEKEKEEQAIFELASGGFESTVRLAKSNPSMWVPIFKENRENVLDVLNEYISQVRKFKACLEKENYGYLEDLIVQANGIRKIIR